MRKLFTRVFLLSSIFIFSFSLVGCSKVTLTPTPTAEPLLDANSTYQRSKHYYLFGIIGEEHINVREVCKGETPKQMQAQTTFLDGLLGIVTLGIYTPRTISVWC